MIRCYWTVSSGMIIGAPDTSRRFEITAREWEATPDKTLLFLGRWHQAVAFATQMQLNSASGLEPSWVTIEYVCV